jgi:hypothetical protein
MKIWLDDIRAMPDEFDIHVKTAQEAIKLLKTGEVTLISLDHDLGNEETCGNGYRVALWIEKAAYRGEIPWLDWRLHTANPIGREKMKKALQNATKWWTENE